MKALALSTALVAALAAPVLANAAPAAEAIFNAEAASSQELVLIGNSAGNATADAILAAEARADDDLNLFGATSGSEVISTQSFDTNAVAARIFAAEAASN